MEKIKHFFAVIISTVCEKDKDKAETLDIPFVLSATRVAIIAGIALFWSIVTGKPDVLTTWPVATFGIVLHFALPITNALKQVDPEQVIDYAKKLTETFG